MAETNTPQYVKYNTRIQLKYDSWANWYKIQETFTPLAGEICIVEVPDKPAAGEPETPAKINPPVCLIKVGDGKTTFKVLPWLSATAADVHEWAKKSETDFKSWLTGKDGPKLATQEDIAGITELIGDLGDAKDIPEYVGKVIDTAIDDFGNKLATNNSNANKKKQTITGFSYNAETNTVTPTYENIEFPPAATVDTAITQDSPNAVSGGAVYTETQAIRTLIGNNASAIEQINNKISNAMHFIGFTDTAITDGGKEVPTIKDWAGEVAYTPAAGDVVISNGVEYVYTSTGVWEQLGQDSSFIVVGTKFTNTDIADNAAISQTKIAYSDAQTTGKTLADNITELNKAITDHNEAYNALNGAAWKSTLSTKGESQNVYTTASGAVAGNTADLTIGNIPVTCLVFSCGGAGEN